MLLWVGGHFRHCETGQTRVECERRTGVEFRERTS